MSAREIEYLRHGGRADFHETKRGGQTTFHGPGQLVAYPILDLKRYGLSARCYVSLLEDVIIKVCGRYGVKAIKTKNTGVWTSDVNKIAAIGVHMRRNVTSHGIALNVNTDLSFFDRIVACGLEDKRATSLEKEGVIGVGVDEVGTAFVEEMVKKLDGVDGVEAFREEEIKHFALEKDAT